MKWLACELHTHTVHSDGSQTLQELASGAGRLGFDAIALTDHNTMSGLNGREDAQRDSGLMIIPGMEWTTFYGHLVTIGLDGFVDWRKAKGAASMKVLRLYTVSADLPDSPIRFESEARPVPAASGNTRSGSGPQ